MPKTQQGKIKNVLCSIRDHMCREVKMGPMLRRKINQLKLTQMLELANQDSKIFFMCVFHMFISRDMEDIRKTQIKVLEVFDSLVSKIKNALHGIDGRLDTTEEGIS